MVNKPKKWNLGIKIYNFTNFSTKLEILQIETERDGTLTSADATPQNKFWAGTLRYD